ncbi:MAG TPA: xanthine dehydrogenase family protein molybdopterin-binding subunit [Candidatus Izemoplasmatales bacterium]|nr:xanthine dehydrogenase family protein molybdopterin-binding subunit [Candidatus Izemoplasmatales bacterium]
MKIVHQKWPSLDGKGLMLGRQAYTDDFAEKDSLILKVLRSPHPFARIRAIDVKAAKALPGVECVLTHEDFPRIPFTRAGQGYPEPSPHDKFVLDSVVRYIGDEVAVVAAIDEATAKHALDLIKVDYELLEPVLDFETAKDHLSVLHPEPEIHEMFPIGFDPKKNVAASYHMEIGDVEATLKACDVVIEKTFYTQAQSHSMMEPHSCNARFDVYDRLVIYSSTQTPVHVRRILSQALQIPISRIRVIKPRVGGGFGGKQAIHGEMLLAAVAMRTKKPCKLVYTRKEVFESSYSRHPMRMAMRLGAMKDGTLKAIDCQVLSDTGAYGEHALTVFMVTGSKVLPLYNKVESVRFGGDVVYTNHTPSGAFRGYGAIQGNFALESAVDILCEALQMDPVAFRMKNMMREGETSPIFAIMGEGTEGTAMMMNSCKLPYCVERGMELIDWKNKYPRVPLGAEKVRGVGMAIAMQGSGIPLIDMASATLKLNDGGFYNLTVGATDIGQKSDTILGQIAAEELQTTPDKIVVTSSDTDLTPFDTGAYASSTTYVSGNAVLKAAKAMKRALFREASAALDLPEDQLRFDGVCFRGPGKEITLEALSNRLYYNADQKQISVTESYVGHQSPPPFMAGFAEVEVDRKTGETRVLKYATVTDCGTTINPVTARGQIEGAVIQGIGMALYEDVLVSPTGKLLTGDFLSYRIPTRLDVGELLTEFAESYEETGPFGAKSVAEIGIDTPPAAIANAIANAVGVRITDLPASPEKIWKALKER